MAGVHVRQVNHMRLSCASPPTLCLLFRHNVNNVRQRRSHLHNNIRHVLWESPTCPPRYFVRHLRSASALSNAVPQSDFDLTAVAFATAIAAACGYVARTRTTLAEATVKPVDRIITRTEIEQHNTESSCWITINDGVYDVTEFLQYHPGGKGSILTKAGVDATTEFAAFHKTSVLADVAQQYKIGVLPEIDGPHKQQQQHQQQQQQQQDSVATLSLKHRTPQQTTHVTTRCSSVEVRALCSIHAMEAEALKRGAPSLIGSYVNSGSEDEESLCANRNGFQRYTLRPRVLRDVRNVNTTTTILGGRITLSFPVSIAPFAGASAVHEDGELAVARAASKHGVVYTVPHYGAHPLPDVVATASHVRENPDLMLQLYPKKKGEHDECCDREFLAGAVAYAARLGVKAIVVTVDVVNNSNREKTYKNPKWIAAMIDEVGGFPPVRTLEAANVVANTGNTAKMNWEDVVWLVQKMKEEGDIALVIKGIMTPEDTAIAAALGVDGVIISNHGGRQLDGTDGPIEVLGECVIAAQGRCDVFMDGGVRRGKDVFKALALGAKAVFIGRPTLWGLAVGGEQGVTRALELLNEELVTVMQLCGVNDVGDITNVYLRDHGAQARTQER